MKEKIKLSSVGIIFDVYSELGYGYQEKYYDKAISKSFDENNIPRERQLVYKVKFKGKSIGIQYLVF